MGSGEAWKWKTTLADVAPRLCSDWVSRDGPADASGSDITIESIIQSLLCSLLRCVQEVKWV